MEWYVYIAQAPTGRYYTGICGLYHVATHRQTSLGRYEKGNSVIMQFGDGTQERHTVTDVEVGAVREAIQSSITAHKRHPRKKTKRTHTLFGPGPYHL